VQITEIHHGFKTSCGVGVGVAVGNAFVDIQDIQEVGKAIKCGNALS
jgi:hypothetical protein